MLNFVTRFKSNIMTLDLTTFCTTEEYRRSLPLINNDEFNPTPVHVYTVCLGRLLNQVKNTLCFAISNI